VIIPWAEQLQFRHDQTHMRREQAKYLSLIAASALLHQHQRPRRAQTVNDTQATYIEATRDDALLVNRLLSDLGGQRLDGLLPQTRQLLVLIDDHVTQQVTKTRKSRSQVRFTQRELREALSWGDFQLRRHLARLIELEYVVMHRTGRGNQREYELLYDGQGRDGKPFLLGLIDADQIEASLPAPSEA
jgi:hypothetical protein